MLEQFLGILTSPILDLLRIPTNGVVGIVLDWALKAGLIVALGWLAWELPRIVRRFNQAKEIQEAKAANPNATLIVVADFRGLGKERDTHWGDTLISRLEEDFPVMANGGAVEIRRWTRRYSTNIERATGAVERDLSRLGADLVLWGKSVGGEGIEVLILAATAPDTASRPAILDFATPKGGPRLNEEMGNAIAFFAARAANLVADIFTIRADRLVSLAVKLTALVNTPPPGLTEDQREDISAAFDEVAFASVARAYPPEIVGATLISAREAAAKCASSCSEWVKWAEAAVTTGKHLKQVSQKMGDICDADQKHLDAKLMWATALNAERIPTLAKDASILADEVSRISQNPTVKTRALTELAKAYCTLGRRTSNNELATQHLERAVRAADEACSLSDVSNGWDWMWAHRTLSEATRSLAIKGNSQLYQRSLSACENGLGGLSYELSPRAGVILLLEKASVQLERSAPTVSDRKQYLRSAADLALQCASMLPREVMAARRRAEAILIAAEATLKMGALDQDEFLFEEARSLGMQAIDALAGNARAAADAWSVIVRARIATASIQLREVANQFEQEKRRELERSVAREMIASVSQINDQILPYRPSDTHPLHFADAMRARGQAKKHLSSLPDAAASLHVEAVGDLEAAATIFERRGDLASATDARRLATNGAGDSG